MLLGLFHRRCYLIHQPARFQRCALIMTRVMVYPAMVSGYLADFSPASTRLVSPHDPRAPQRHRNRPQPGAAPSVSLIVSFDPKSSHKIRRLSTFSNRARGLCIFRLRGPAESALLNSPRFKHFFYVLRLLSINPWLILV